MINKSWAAFLLAVFLAISAAGCTAGLTGVPAVDGSGGSQPENPKTTESPDPPDGDKGTTEVSGDAAAAVAASMFARWRRLDPAEILTAVSGYRLSFAFDSLIEKPDGIRIDPVSGESVAFTRRESATLAGTALAGIAGAALGADVTADWERRVTVASATGVSRRSSADAGTLSARYRADSTDDYLVGDWTGKGPTFGFRRVGAGWEADPERALEGLGFAAEFRDRIRAARGVLTRPAFYISALHARLRDGECLLMAAVGEAAIEGLPAALAGDWFRYARPREIGMSEQAYRQAEEAYVAAVTKDVTIAARGTASLTARPYTGVPELIEFRLGDFAVTLACEGRLLLRLTIDGAWTLRAGPVRLAPFPEEDLKRLTGVGSPAELPALGEAGR